MKRIAVYAYHNEDCLMSDYAVCFLNGLLEVADEIVVVINGIVYPEELKKIDNHKIKVLQREDKGFEFHAYKAGFLNIEFEKLKEYDELIFANSSTYGPIYSLTECFKKMLSKEVDFWGITKHPSVNKNAIKFRPKTKIKEHLQSYFMVFRNNMFMSPVFKEYFQYLREVSTKEESFGYIEVSFTKYFKEFGFKYEALIDDEILKIEAKNSNKYLPDVLVREYSCPIIKKSVFAAQYELEPNEKQYTNKAKLFHFIEKNTKYDASLIIKDIAPDYRVDDIKRLLGLNFALSETHRENFFYVKCAVYTNCAELLEPHLKGFGGFVKLIETEEIPKNIDYDYALIFYPTSKETEYLMHQINCTIKNRTYVTNIINVFLKNPYIGILTPTPFMYNGFEFYQDYISKKDARLFEEDVEPAFLSTISGVFWAKKEALRGVEFNSKSTLNKGMQAIIHAKKNGFLTGAISNTDTLEQYSGMLEYFAFCKNKKSLKLKKK